MMTSCQPLRALNEPLNVRLKSPHRTCYPDPRCGYDVMVACQLPKLNARVRFPLPAPTIPITYGAKSLVCKVVLQAVYRPRSLFGLIERLVQSADALLDRCISADVAADDARNRLLLPAHDPGDLALREAGLVESGRRGAAHIMEVKFGAVRPPRQSRAPCGPAVFRVLAGGSANQERTNDVIPKPDDLKDISNTVADGRS